MLLKQNSRKQHYHWATEKHSSETKYNDNISKHNKQYKTSVVNVRLLPIKTRTFHTHVLHKYDDYIKFSREIRYV